MTTAVVATLLAALAACGETGAGARGTESAPGSATNAPSGAPSSPADDTATAKSVADPEHAVAMPGKRKGALNSADMLILSKDSIDDDVVEELEKLDKVTAVTRFSMAQVPIENKLYNLAAVDPASYRNFTQVESADFQEQWDRVAGGELAMPKVLQKRLPVDAKGYLKVGVGDEGVPIHIGAFAPQASTIDMVVNDKWGESLGMTLDNAVLVSTGTAPPQALRAPVEEIVGDDVTVALTDIATRLGLDPDAVQTAVVVGSYAQAVGTFNYRVLAGGRVEPDASWVREHISTEVVPILGSVTCNRFMMPQLKAALAEIVQRGLASKINPGEYAGCYYPRFIAGSSSLSNHAFGLALDMNVPGNQRGTVGEMDRGVVDTFKKWGFAWGGDWRYTDPMHFELARIVNPG